MGRKTVRVPLPKGYPTKFIDLMKHIVEKHEELGPSSPLNAPSIIDMADFKQKLEQADTLRQESEYHRAMAESKMNQAQVLLGTSAGQTINTDGTLYYMLHSIKRLLLVTYSGVEESLTPFGFNVVIGSAKGGGRPKKVK